MSAARANGVLVVDDHPSVREGIRAMLADEAALGPILTAEDGRQALSLVKRVKPAVVVLDYNLPDEDGISLCLRLKASDAPSAVLIYSAFADERLDVLAVVAGADALVSKAAEPAELSTRVHALVAGRTVFPQVQPAAAAWASTALDAEDLPILGMLRHLTPPAEIATTLGLTDGQLIARRWAMLHTLRRGRARAASTQSAAS